MFQNSAPILQVKFVADNLVDLNLATFEISQGARKSVNLRERAFDRYFAAKKIEGVESDGVSFRINSVHEESPPAARELERVFTHRSRASCLYDVVEPGRTQLVQLASMFFWIVPVDDNGLVSGEAANQLKFRTGRRRFPNSGKFN